MTGTEVKRIEALKKYDILDTPPDEIYDHIVGLTARLLNTPMAMISLVDRDRIWFKSAFGVDVQQIPREDGLCSTAILSEGFYMVEDALKDPRTAGNTLVTGGFVRFYAAVPLTASDGYRLGTLCVLDKEPRTLTPGEQQILADMAFIAMGHIELRLMTRQAISSRNKMAYMITHDIRGSVCSIPVLVDMIKENKKNTAEVELLGDMIILAAEKSIQSVDSFLEYARSLSNDIVYRFEPFDFSLLIQRVVRSNEVFALKKQQQMIVSLEKDVFVNGDKTRLSELVNNLLSNAVKYSPKNSRIYVRLSKEKEEVVLEVKDEGLGMTKKDRENAFMRFSKLSSRPTGNEPSTGLGLWVVDEITRRHGGSVKVASAGKGKGTTFTVVLPAARFLKKNES
jgi:signal transduction histidine kinase